MSPALFSLLIAHRSSLNSFLLAALPFILFFLFAGGVWLLLMAWVPVGLHLFRRLVAHATGWVDRRPSLASRRVALTKRISPWIAYLPVTLILAAGLALTGIAAAQLLDLIEALQSNSVEMSAIDTTVHEWARDARNEPLTRFFIVATLLGTPVGLASMALVVSIILLFGRRYRWVGFLWVTAVGAGLLNLALKSHFERARPTLTEALRGAHGYSFPSGHAMGSIAVAGAFAYLAVRGFKSWRTQSALLALCISFVLAVCSSRIYLGVHWISDIAAGLLAGGMWVITTTLSYETFRRIRAARRGHQAALPVSEQQGDLNP